MVLVAMLLMAVPRLVFGVIIFEIDEISELILAVAFLIFGIDVVKSSHCRRGPNLAGRYKAAPSL
jgi:hypothetical protein